MLLSRLQRASRSALRTYATVAEASGVKVAGFEGGSPPATTSITVVVKGGARYESKPGVAHVLKNFAFKSTAGGSALKTARETELYGGVLSSALSREHLYLTAQFLRGDEAHFLELLASVLSSTHYYPHEYAELVLPSIESETLASLASPSTLALDLAHSIAFRRGLGNSLYASPHSPVSAADVKAYAQQAYAKSNIAVLGGGISTDNLAKAVQSAFGGSSSGGSSLSGSTSTYYGGEQRVPLDVHATPGAQPTLIIAFGSAGEAKPELKVLPHLLGGQSSIKWTPGTSPLALIADKVPGSSIKATLYPYSDASLLAVQISAPTSEAVGTLAKEAVQAIKAAGSAKAEEVKKAIAQAKFAEATKFEYSDLFLQTAGPALFSGSIPAPDSSFASLDKVTASALTKSATELFKAKPTVVAVGDLGVLPYADELGF
ncbi:putative ubiquinol-cytochrome C reductase complex core protein 2 precursor [Naematelia encephala]|uniref:Cytochrome b-c1 complex subunit 2, mitochondrial n=1 Tax=Naematelia encephala TaxID=71784 RepID=A0A1Y2BDT3_9TREE|nr:putative ubiquinol-cytochrome C reductase complex core protein 2 precursor [Naematelia encephala]